MHCIDQWQCGHEDLQPSLAGRIFSCKPQLHVMGWHRWEEELQCPWTRGTCCTVGLLCKRNMRLLHISHAPCLSFPFPPPPLPVQHRWSEAPEHAAIFKQELDRYVEISKIFQLVNSHKISSGTEDSFQPAPYATSTKNIWTCFS